MAAEQTEQTPQAAEPEYPAHWEADVAVGDGGVAHVRPIRPDDAGRLVPLHSRLSERTRYLRSFAPYPRLSDRARRCRCPTPTRPNWYGPPRGSVAVRPPR